MSDPQITLTPDQLTSLQNFRGENLPALGQFARTLQQQQQAATQQAQTRTTQQQTAQRTAAAKKAAADHQQGIIDQLNNLISSAQYTQVTGQGAQALGGQIQRLLAQLPYNVANTWMQKNSGKGGLLAGTALGTAVQQASQQAAGPTGPAKPTFDPLALQTMWSQVFGPAWNAASQMAGSVGPGYLSSMQQAIAGSNASPQQRQQMLGQAGAMANMLQATSRGQTQASAAQIPFDTLINALSQATGAAQLAQGQSEKAIAYGQALPFTSGSTTGGATGLSPLASSNLLNTALGQPSPGAAISSQQTSSTAGTNPLMPQFGGYVP